MNFLRPEVRQFLHKWSEPLVMAAVLLFGVWLYLRGEAAANAPLIVIAFVVIGAAAALLVLAFRRVRLRGDLRAAGIVEVQERKITYYGPDDGGVVSLDDLRRIDIVASHSLPFVDTLTWRLSDHEGRALNIPVGAKGTDIMIDNFSILNGVDYDLIVTAMAAKGDAVFTIWRKPT